MPLVIPDDYANWTVTITNSSAGASAKSTIAWGTLTTGTFGQTQVSRIANLFRDGLTPLYDNSWLVGPVKCNFTVAGLPLVLEDTGTEAGTASSTAYASPAVAQVVTKRTGLAGRRYRGRFYLPGVPEASIDEAGLIDGTRTNAVQAAIDALAGTLFADAALDGSVLFHDSETGGSHVPTPLVAFTVRNVAATMRPRQRR